MYKIFSIIILLCCINSMLFAQQITVLNSTAQPWSGGRVGRTGCYYKFIIQVSGHKMRWVVPDTMWIGNEPIALVLKDSVYGIQNMSCNETNNDITYEIQIGTENDEYKDNPYADEIHFKKLAMHAPLKYEGVAMLSYKIKGKHKYYVIPAIMKSLKPLEYP